MPQFLKINLPYGQSSAKQSTGMLCRQWHLSRVSFAGTVLLMARVAFLSLCSDWPQLARAEDLVQIQRLHYSYIIGSILTRFSTGDAWPADYVCGPQVFRISYLKLFLTASSFLTYWPTFVFLIKIIFGIIRIIQFDKHLTHFRYNCNTILIHF